MTGDTTPEAERERIRIFRAMTPERRLELALEMSDDVQAVYEAGRRARDEDPAMDTEDAHPASDAPEPAA